MRKFINILSIVTVSLLMSMSVATASQKGQGLCDFHRSLLKSNGYSEQATYSPEGIRKIFKDIKVEPSDLSFLAEGKQYHLTFSCETKNKLGYASFEVVPTDLQPGDKTGTISWTFSKPSSGQ